MDFWKQNDENSKNKLIKDLENHIQKIKNEFESSINVFFEKKKLEIIDSFSGISDAKF